MAARFQRSIGPARNLPSEGAPDFASGLKGLGEQMQRRGLRNRLQDVQQQGTQEGLAGTAEMTGGQTDAQRTYNAAAQKGFESRLTTKARADVTRIMSEHDGRSMDDIDAVTQRVDAAYSEILSAAPEGIREGLQVELDLRRTDAVARITQKANGFELQRNVATIEDGITARSEDYLAAMQDGNAEIAGALRGEMEKDLGDLVEMGLLTEEQAGLRMGEADEAAAAESMVGAFTRSVRSSAGAAATMTEFSRNPPEGLGLGARARVLSGMSRHASVLGNAERQARAAVGDERRANKGVVGVMAKKAAAGIPFSPEEDKFFARMATPGAVEVEPEDRAKLAGALNGAAIREEVLGLSVAEAKARTTYDRPPGNLVEYEGRKVAVAAVAAHEEGFDRDPLGYGAQAMGTPLPPLDPTGDLVQQFGDRARMLEKVKEVYGEQASLVTANDVRVVRGAVESMEPAEAVGLLSLLVDAAKDTDTLDSTLGDLLGKGEAPAMASAASFVARGRADLAETSLRGARSKGLLPGGEKGLSKRASAIAAAARFGASVPTDNPEFEVAAEAAANLARGWAIEEGNLDLDEDEAKELMLKAIGETFGVQESIQGQLVTIPTAINPLQLQDGLEALTADTIGALGRFALYSPEEIEAAIDDGSAGIQNIAPGAYRIMIGPHELRRENGSRFVLSDDDLAGIAEGAPLGPDQITRSLRAAGSVFPYALDALEGAALGTVKGVAGAVSGAVTAISEEPEKMRAARARTKKFLDGSTGAGE
jgi:hypothetical protein